MKKIKKVLLLGLFVFLSSLIIGCSKHEHSYGNWNITKNADCINAGLEERICECGEKETREIPATNVHNYGSWKTVVSASCTSTGRKERTCNVCGNKETQTISVTSHSYKSATCNEPATCKNCGVTTGTALGHNIVNGSCTRCNYQEKTAFDLLKEYIKKKGTYSDGDYELTIWTDYVSDFYYKVYLTYASDKNNISLKCFVYKTDYSFLTSIVIPSTASNTYDWAQIDRNENYMTGLIYYKTYNENSTLTYTKSLNISTSSLKESYLKLANTQIKIILNAYKLFMSDSNVTLKDLGFESY